MKIPKWVPQVGLPWNCEFRETWGAMTPGERRWSFAFDVVIVLAMVFIASALSGCDKSPGAVSVGTANSSAPDGTYPPSEDIPDQEGMVFRDSVTGCQYLTFNHGATPRMGRYEDGVQKQMGCFETLHMVDPTKGLDK